MADSLQNVINNLLNTEIENKEKIYNIYQPNLELADSNIKTLEQQLEDARHTKQQIRDMMSNAVAVAAPRYEFLTEATRILALLDKVDQGFKLISPECWLESLEKLLPKEDPLCQRIFDEMNRKCYSEYDDYVGEYYISEYSVRCDASGDIRGYKGEDSFPDSFDFPDIKISERWCPIDDSYLSLTENLPYMEIYEAEMNKWADAGYWGIDELNFKESTASGCINTWLWVISKHKLT